MTTYTTRDEAILREIVVPIEEGEARAAEFDVEAIADEVLGDYGQGYALQVDFDEFWATVARHAIPAATLRTIADHFGRPIEYGDFVDVPIVGDVTVRISEDDRPGTFYGGTYLSNDDDESVEESRFGHASLADLDAIVDTARSTYGIARPNVGDHFVRRSSRTYSEGGERREHQLELLCRVVSVDRVGFHWRTVEVVSELNRPTSFPAFVPEGGQTAWFGWDAAVERGDAILAATSWPQPAEGE